MKFQTTYIPGGIYINIKLISLNGKSIIKFKTTYIPGGGNYINIKLISLNGQSNHSETVLLVKTP